MIVVFDEVPLLVLLKAVLGSVEKHLPKEDERALLLLPLAHAATVDTRRKKFRPEYYRIALDYQIHDINPAALAFLADNVIGDLRVFPTNLRIPYILFIYSETFRQANRDLFEHGQSVHRLIKKLIEIRA